MEEVTLDAGLSRDCPRTRDVAMHARPLADAAGLTYEWNMDDRGIVLTGRVIKYQFPRRGDYKVKLTVTNARRQSVVRPPTPTTSTLNVITRP